MKQYTHKILRDFFDWRPRAVSVPRSRCHFLSLDVRNIPQRQLASSLRLQLAQLCGLTKFGFAWRADAGHALAWYWDEADLTARDLTPPDGASANGIEPWPEPLLRAPLHDGLYLIACAQGCEAVAIDGGKLRRTRWYPERPTQDLWTAFLRDAGCDPASHRLPPPSKASALGRPAKGWKVATHLVKPITARTWGAVAALAFGGMLLMVGIVHELKLDAMIQAQQAEMQKLKQDNATTIDLLKQVAEQGGYVDAMVRARPNVLQLILMKGMAESGLVRTATSISIAEWEYRNNRLRILFVVPEDGFSLGEFLAKLEALPMFKEIRLMPDTPPRTVGIQATLAGDDASSRKAPVASATAASNS